jgi:hypothetical protein
MASFGLGAEQVDWQQFYVPQRAGFGTSPEYVNQANQESLREAMLKAAQINQANAQTSAMSTSAENLWAQSQGLVRNEYGGWVPGKTPTSSGGTKPMPAGGTTSVGSYPLSGGGGMIPTGISVTQTPTVPGGGQSTSEQQRYDPWSRYRGEAGIQLAGDMRQGSPSDFYQQKLQAMSSGEFSPDDPSYQFRFQQGQQAAERSLAARGLLNSGNAAIELQQYGQGAASQEYGAQFSRMLQGLQGVEGAYNQQMGRLMSMAGVNIDPTAGGQLGVQQGELGLRGQSLLNEWSLGNRELDIKQQLANQAQQGQMAGMGGSDWSAIFNTGNR